MVLPLRSATDLMVFRTTMPSPPLDQSTCWNTRGDVRESRDSSGANSVIMSTVPHNVWTLPAAKASRATTGSSISTISTLKPYFFEKTLSAFGFVPRFAAMTGSHPDQTLYENRRNLLFASHLYWLVPLTAGSRSPGTYLYSLTVVTPFVSGASVWGASVDPEPED